MRIGNLKEFAQNHVYSKPVKFEGRRAPPAERAGQLLDFMIEHCASDKPGAHYLALTHHAVAEAAGISGPSVFTYFPTREEFNSVIIWWAEANLRSSSQEAALAAKRIMCQIITNDRAYAEANGFSLRLFGV